MLERLKFAPAAFAALSLMAGAASAEGLKAAAE